MARVVLRPVAAGDPLEPLVRYARYSRHVADHPSTADLITALGYSA